MPKNRTLSVMFATFPYAGNSTGTSLNWQTSEWLTRTFVRLKTEEKFTSRMHALGMEKYADTPITLTRNKSVRDAREQGFDVLVMVDSDMGPDCRLGSDPEAVPFFDTAFDAIYSHYDRGPLVVAAPYGGCPPHENMFVFTWAAMMNGGGEAPFELRQFTREEARSFSGLHHAAALPTGLIMYDLRAFDYIDPPWFQYEWTDEYQTQKASTEDVQNTRDIGVSIQRHLGYNPLLCAWSSWAKHYKVWGVDKPAGFTVEDVSATLANALQKDVRRADRVLDFGAVNRVKGVCVNGRS